MAKVARASISAVQSAAESQQLLPALQQLLETCSIASRTANAAECDAISSVPCRPPTSHSSLEDAAHTASCSYPYQEQVAPGLQHYRGRHWLRPLSTHSTPHSAACISAADGSAGSPGKGTAGGPKQHSTSSSSSNGSGSGAQAQADPLTLALDVLRANSYSSRLTPSKIVQQLDKHIVGQPVGGTWLLSFAHGTSSCACHHMQPAGLRLQPFVANPLYLLGKPSAQGVMHDRVSLSPHVVVVLGSSLFECIRPSDVATGRVAELCSVLLAGCQARSGSCTAKPLAPPRAASRLG